VVQGFFVTGTDTDVGKTVVAAWLVARLGACYWKPVQAGTHPETDSATVRRLSGATPDRILPEAYVLAEPMAPHEAARREGIAVDMAKLVPPPCNRPLVAEGAGGLMVPLNDQSLASSTCRSSSSRARRSAPSTTRCSRSKPSGGAGLRLPAW
jgi:dethiobiotin synthase